MRNTTLLALLLGALSLGTTPVAADSQSGLFQVYGQYEDVRPAQPTQTPDQVEVVELFWYGCPHCFHFEPYLKRWLEQKPAYASFVRIPAVFSEKWMVHAQAYYTAEALGVLDKVHEPLFDAVQNKRRTLDTEAELATFFEEHGVSKQDFLKAFNSFTVKARTRRATLLTKRYGIDGVPAVIVNGKYRTSGSQAGSYENLIKVMNTLVEEEHRAMSATAPTKDGTS